MVAVSTNITVKFPGINNQNNDNIIVIVFYFYFYFYSKIFIWFLFFSNTKVKLFVKFAEATEAFKKIVNTTETPNAVEALKRMPLDQCCPLSFASDMLLMLTNGLKSHPDVVPLLGLVSSSSFNDHGDWNVEVVSDGERSIISSSLLIFCTGSSPISPSLPIKIAGTQSLDLDIALSPSLLSKEIPITPIIIAVIGASHSAILVLMNLFHLSSSSHPHLKIKWFTRHELRYAEEKEGWILRDNTGLKGDTAKWARENLENDQFHSQVSKKITKIEYKAGLEEETFVKYMPGCDRYVQAIGYKRDDIPIIRKREKGREEEKEEVIVPTFDSKTGGFEDERGEKIKGLYGAGIAFPERVMDPYGNVEHAVGFWKFMKFVKKVVKGWK